MYLYQEKQTSDRAWVILLVICMLAWIALWLGKDRETVVLPTLLVGMFGGITVLTLWGNRRYGDIRLSDRELRVGRGSFALADLVPGTVSGPGEPVRGKLVGGAYAPTLGNSVVGVVHRDRRQLVIQTKRPDQLRAALTRALAAYEV